MEKKRQLIDKGEDKQLFIVGPWFGKKKAGGDDLESIRKENGDNMNAHLNWHTDDVLEFELVLFNPLSVPLPLTSIELFEEKNSRLLASLDNDSIGCLAPREKKKLQLRFRASQAA